MSKTIAAISSAIGNSGISVIRISGDKAIEIADLIFKNINDIKLKDKKGYTASYGYIYDGDHKIDDCVATVFRNPNSYTGEDVVELSVHGGIISSKLTLRLLLAHGAVLAEPGEFTKRAFLNNKMDLIEAESVMDLISSKSILSHKAALDIKEGALSRKINDIKNGLVSLCGHLQAHISGACRAVNLYDCFRIDPDVYSWRIGIFGKSQKRRREIRYCLNNRSTRCPWSESSVDGGFLLW